MSISPENASKALHMVGLARGGPIRADVRDAKIADAARLARFMDHLDAPLPDGVELPALKPRI